MANRETVTLNAERAPHFSYSRIQKYLACPEQYRLYYVEKLRTKVENASLVFGSVMHLALAAYFRHKRDPVRVFEKEWNVIREVELRYSRAESWQALEDKGKKLLLKFCNEEAPKIGKVVAVEEPFRLGLSNSPYPLIGTIDLLAELNSTLTIVDFKTSVSEFEDYEVELLDQLTVYQLAYPEAQQVAICVFVKSRDPHIEWHVTKRQPLQMVEYLEKVDAVARQIEQEVFYKRVGKWCRQCEFLPVCVGDMRKANETLVSLR